MFQVETGDSKHPPKKYEKIYVNQMHRITCRFTHSILIDNRNPRDLIPAICTFHVFSKNVIMRSTIKF